MRASVELDRGATAEEDKISIGIIQQYIGTRSYSAAVRFAIRETAKRISALEKKGGEDAV